MFNNLCQRCHGTGMILESNNNNAIGGTYQSCSTCGGRGYVESIVRVDISDVANVLERKERETAVRILSMMKDMFRDRADFETNETARRIGNHYNINLKIIA